MGSQMTKKWHYLNHDCIQKLYVLPQYFLDHYQKNCYNYDLYEKIFTILFSDYDVIHVDTSHQSVSKRSGEIAHKVVKFTAMGDEYTLKLRPNK